jgi:hypothetical protein
MKMPAGGPAAAQGRRPTEFSQRAQGEEFSRQKAKIKRQKISAPGRGPDWGEIFRGWPQAKQLSMTQSSMTQFSSGAGNRPPRGIFAAREEMGL